MRPGDEVTAMSLAVCRTLGYVVMVIEHQATQTPYP